MNNYIIIDREAGNTIESCPTLEQAKKVLAEYEESERKRKWNTKTS